MINRDPSVSQEVERMYGENEGLRFRLIKWAVLHYLTEIAEMEEALSNANDPPDCFVTEKELIENLGL
jgi:hypothetical protein